MSIRLELGLVATLGGSTISIFSRPLALAILPWVGETSSGDVYDHHGEETASTV